MGRERAPSAVETARLRLRRWREQDVDDYAQLAADPEVARYLTPAGGGPLTLDQSRQSIERFERDWDQHGFGIWAVEETATGALIGRIGLQHHEDWPEDPHNVEVGWILGRPFWGRGLATEGARGSLRYGFEEVGLERIISITDPGHRASRRVMEKAGLSLAGQTRWRGGKVVWYAVDHPTWMARRSRSDRGEAAPPAANTQPLNS